MATASPDRGERSWMLVPCLLLVEQYNNADVLKYCRTLVSGAQALTAGGIVVTETFSPRNARPWSREIKFSAAGLEQALRTPLQNCGASSWKAYPNLRIAKGFFDR